MGHLPVIEWTPEKAEKKHENTKTRSHKEDWNMNTMDRLMELVEDKGLTLFQIAQMSDISYNTLKRTRERGGQLSVDTIEALCGALGVTMAEFFATADRRAG